MGSLWLLIIAICTVTFFWRVGESEYDSNPVPALISLALWGIGIFGLHAGILTNLLLQGLLFVALTIYNIRRGPQ